MDRLLSTVHYSISDKYSKPTCIYTLTPRGWEAGSRLARQAILHVLLCSHKSVIGPYPEPGESSLEFPLDFSNI